MRQSRREPPKHPRSAAKKVAGRSHLGFPLSFLFVTKDEPGAVGYTNMAAIRRLPPFTFNRLLLFLVAGTRSAIGI